MKPTPITPSHILSKCFLFFVAFALACKFAMVVGVFAALAIAFSAVFK